MRQGLRTRDPVEAEKLRNQLNELLADGRYHDAAARAESERRFDERVVEIFFYKMVPEETDYRTVRNNFIRLPNFADDGYRSILLLGTTGAGKTTLGRQLIGTDPETERFPSTSTAKTTVHDIEIVVASGPWKGIATFASMEEVREYLSECASAAVLAAWNVLASIGEDLGPFAERALRKRLENARVFLAGIDRSVSGATKEGARTIAQLEKLLILIDEVVERPEPSKAKPYYDRMNLVLAVRAAAEGFHDAWFPRLGLQHKTGVGKEHWTRVKALSRRLATGMADHYDSLQPVADLRKELQDRIYVFVQNPLKWEGKEPEDDEKQVVFDALADAIARRMLVLASQRVWKEKGREWQSAYDKQGRGSTYERAEIIGTQIFAPAAPIPDVTPSIDRNQFLREVASEVTAAADECGAMLA